MTDSSEKGAGTALQAVVAALEPLKPEERRRILDAAATFFGTPVPTAFEGPPTSANPNRPAGTAGSKPLSINEFLDKAMPSTNPQRIASFAFYREKQEGKPQFSRTDLRSYFAKAKESEPSNYDRDFGIAVKEGWIHEDGAQSYLTRTGEDLVSAGFKGKAKAVAKKRGRRKAVSS